MPAIEGVTVPHQELHYLRPELRLDFISVTPQQILFVTPIAVLYSTLGVLQRTELRKIPVAVAGRVTLSRHIVGATLPAFPVDYQCRNPKITLPGGTYRSTR
ncbi:hypothetical protein [Klebsiella sp. HSTU-Sny5]|uniref:hypothetical protein n=1 Tax=Klebsiella sp. HSTU-Sny5 TaxID=2663238 RepID=UPI00391D6B81